MQAPQWKWNAPSRSSFNSFEFLFEGGKLRFQANFTPMSTQAYDTLRHKDLKMAKDKDAMKSGVYSTSNKNRQLALLNLAIEEGAIPLPAMPNLNSASSRLDNPMSRGFAQQSSLTHFARWKIPSLWPRV